MGQAPGEAEAFTRNMPLYVLNGRAAEGNPGRSPTRSVISRLEAAAALTTRTVLNRQTVIRKERCCILSMNGSDPPVTTAREF